MLILPFKETNHAYLLKISVKHNKSWNAVLYLPIGTTHEYLLEISVKHNKSWNVLLYINCIYARSSPQII